jgi:GTP cyclohydrolase I
VAYIPTKNSKIIGLSKLNRIVDWYARRPQLQEQLTQQIHDYINKATEGNLGVAVTVEAQHMCVYLRGVEDDSTMKTTKLSGVFFNNENNARGEFFDYIRDLKK